MALLTYDFDGSVSDSGTDWSNIANVADGSTSTAASTTAGDSSILKVSGTDAPSTGDTIGMVRARMYYKKTGNINLEWEIYTSGQTDLILVGNEPIKTTAGWGDWITQLDPPSGGWTWSDIQDLEFTVYTSSSGAGPYLSEVYKIELEVSTDEGNRYWVHTNSLWNNTSNWSYNSGGPTGATIPTTSESIVFDAESTGTIYDNFNDNSLDTSFWVSSGSVSETNQNIEMSLTGSSPGYNTLYTGSTYDMTDRCASVEVVDAGEQSWSSIEVILKLYLDSSNDLSIIISNGNVLSYKKVGGTSTLLDTTTYDSQTMKFFRIRQAGTDVYWEWTDRQGDGNWTQLHNEANPITMTSLAVYLQAGNYSTETGTSTVKFDQFYIYDNSGDKTILVPHNAGCHDLIIEEGYKGQLEFDESYFHVEVTGSIEINTDVELNDSLYEPSGFRMTSSSAETIKTSGTTMIDLLIDGSGTFTLQDDYFLSGRGHKLSIFQGTFNTNNYNIDQDFSEPGYTNLKGREISFGAEGTGTKVINLGSSTLELNAYNTLEATNLTVNAGTSELRILFQCLTQGETLYDVHFFNTSSWASAAMNLVCHDLTIEDTTGGSFTFLNDCEVTGSLYIDQATTSGWGYVGGETPTTLTVNTISEFNNTRVQGITLAGNASPYNGSAKVLYDTGGNSNITFSSGTTRYWVGGSGTWDSTTTTNWSASSGGPGGASVPRPIDNVIFDANSFTGASQTVSITETVSARDFDIQNVTDSPTFSQANYATIVCYGDVHLSSSATFTIGIGRFLTLRGGRDRYFYSHGAALTKELYFGGDPYTTTYIGDDFVSVSYLDIYSKVDLNGSDFQLGKINIVYDDWLEEEYPTFDIGSTTPLFTDPALPLAPGSNFIGDGTVSLSDGGSTLMEAHRITSVPEVKVGSRSGDVYMSGIEVDDLTIGYDINSLSLFNEGPYYAPNLIRSLTIENGSSSQRQYAISNSDLSIYTDQEYLVVDYVELDSVRTTYISKYEYSASSTTYQWETLTGSATSLSLGDDDYSSGVTIPFDVTFYDDESIDTIIISSNGLIGVGPLEYTLLPEPAYSYRLPNADLGPTIAALWGDLDPEEGGTIKYETLGTTPNRTFVVEYNQVPDFSNNEYLNSFQVKFFENSSNIEVHVKEVGGSDPVKQAVQNSYLDYSTLSENFGQFHVPNYGAGEQAIVWTRSLKSNPPAVLPTYYANDSVDVADNENWQFGLVASQDSILSGGQFHSPTPQMFIVQDSVLGSGTTFFEGVADLLIRTVTQSSIFSNTNTFYGGVGGNEGLVTIPASYTFPDPEDLNSSNLKKLKIGEKYGPITSVVLGRQPQNDNIVISSLAPEANVITSIDPNTDLITITGHGLVDGNLIRVSSDGTYPAPLLPDTNYYVYTNGSTDTFALTPSYEKAIAGSNIIDITTAGTGTITLTHLETQEIQINNNQIMDDDRQTLLPSLYAELVGKEWSEVEAETVGLGFHEVGDVVQFTQGDTTVLGLISEIRLTLAGSVKERLVSTIPELENIDYQSAGGIIKTIYNTEIKVDKQENDITSIVSQQDVYATEVQENFTQLYQDLENIAITIQKSGGGNLVDNSVGFSKESATDDSNVNYDKLDFWTYNTDYDIATHGTVNSYSSSASQNQGGISGQTVEMVGDNISLSQTIACAADVPMCFGIRVNKATSGSATITLSNDEDSWSLIVEDGTSYEWEELSILDFKTSLPWLQVDIVCDSVLSFEFTDLRVLYGTNLQGWVQSAREIMATNVQFTQLGMRIFDSVHDTETRVTYNEFSTRSRKDGTVLFEADDAGVVTNDLKINGGTTYKTGGNEVIKQVTIPNGSDLAGIAFIRIL